MCHAIFKVVSRQFILKFVIFYWIFSVSVKLFLYISQKKDYNICELRNKVITKKKKESRQLNFNFLIKKLSNKNAPENDRIKIINVKFPELLMQIFDKYFEL